MRCHRDDKCWAVVEVRAGKVTTSLVVTFPGPMFGFAASSAPPLAAAVGVRLGNNGAKLAPLFLLGLPLFRFGFAASSAPPLAPPES